MADEIFRGRVLAVAFISLVTLGSAAAQEPLPEASNSTIGYPDVATALAALRSRSDITFRDQNGWTIAIDEKARTIWSFSPKGYPAYPAVVRRQVVPRGNGSSITMSIHCEAEKAQCDDLVRTFARMNGFELPR
jgi:hypothetical protein